MQEEMLCPECGAEGEDNFRRDGFIQLYQRKVQRLQCKRCGKVFHQ